MKAPNYNKKLCLALVILTTTCSLSIGQPSIQWQQCYGGSNLDQAISIIKTTDGGFIVCGGTSSNDGDVTGYHDSLSGGYRDVWVVKTDSLGSLIWKRCYGGSLSDGSSSIIQTQDQGYIIAGNSFSNDGDVTAHHGIPGNSYDVWILKLDSSGNIEWQKSYGGTDLEVAYDVKQTLDGGYIFCGYTDSNDGDITFNPNSTGFSDAWIVKINSIGTIEWQKSYGGSFPESAFNILLTSDSGYIFAANTYSFDGQVTGHWGVTTNSDVWVVKIDSVGVLQWQKCLGGTSGEAEPFIEYGDHSNFIVGCGSTSTDGDVTGHHGFSNYYDMWLARIDSFGNLLNQKCLGGSDNDFIRKIRKEGENDFILIGTTESDDGDVIGFHPGFFSNDAWLVKFDSPLNIVWQKCIGGSNGEGGMDICLHQSGYAFCGGTTSIDGDVTCYTGDDEFWIVKLNNTVGINESFDGVSTNVYPNPSHSVFHVEMMNSINAPKSLYIYNMLGEKIVEKNEIQTDAFDFSLMGQPKGLYLLMIVQNDRIYIKRIELI